MKSFEIVRNILLVASVALLCVSVAFGDWAMIGLSAIWVGSNFALKQYYEWMNLPTLQFVRYGTLGMIAGCCILQQIFNYLPILVFALMEMLHYIYFVVLTAYVMDATYRNKWVD